MRERVKDCEEQELYFNFDACMVLCECLCISLVIVYCTVFQLVLIFLLFCSLSVFSRSSSLQRHKYIAATFPLSERPRERAQMHLSTIVQLVLSDTLFISSKIFHSPFLPLRVLFCCLSDFDLLAFLWSAAGSCNAVCLASSEGFEAAICAPCIHLERLCSSLKTTAESDSAVLCVFVCPLIPSLYFHLSSNDLWICVFSSSLIRPPSIITTYISLALTSFTCSHSFRYSLISHSIPALCPLIASTCKIESKRS